MEGEKVFVALPELFVFSHVSFFLFVYVTLAENVFDLILGWVYFGFGSLNGLTVFLESECSFCFDNEIFESLPLLSASHYKIESRWIEQDCYFIIYFTASLLLPRSRTGIH
mmetsp:Transcript_1528/g.2386  ORF Transcript_1528/g.2386 Transcript_1528/m.2386 type:complete len:111 (+) Transcript_1528:639-971(+)